MSIRLRNTKTRQVEAFEPLDPKNVRMYVCGPTVYDRAHLGNARPVVVFDVLFRLLRHVYGADHVTYVRNFTDVDDKINARAAESGRSIGEITAETSQWYLDDMGALGALEPTHMPRATAYIEPMITMISDLIAKGHAYEAEGHVLFRVRSYQDYGALSGRSVDDMIAGARVEVAPFKEDPMDFVLWKPSTDDIPGWDSPWGRGRPGWHIECSAMAYELLGESFDIHGGGIDLQFPHHENEIAQSACAHPEGGFARYWVHNEMLQVEGKKMSKSLGNFFTVRDLLDQGVPGEVIRFVFLQTHYSKPMNYSSGKADSAYRKLAIISSELVSRSWITKEYLASPGEFSRTYLPKEVLDALSDDLNTSLAITILQDISTQLEGLNRVELSDDEIDDAHRKIWSIGHLLGLDFLKFEQFDKAASEGLQKLSEILNSEYQIARSSRDFSRVDFLKNALVEAGVNVQISKDAVELIPTAGFDPKRIEDLK